MQPYSHAHVSTTLPRPPTASRPDALGVHVATAHAPSPVLQQELHLPPGEYLVDATGRGGDASSISGPPPDLDLHSMWPGAAFGASTAPVSHSAARETELPPRSHMSPPPSGVRAGVLLQTSPSNGDATALGNAVEVTNAASADCRTAPGASLVPFGEFIPMQRHTLPPFDDEPVRDERVDHQHMHRALVALTGAPPDNTPRDCHMHAGAASTASAAHADGQRVGASAQPEAGSSSGVGQKQLAPMDQPLLQRSHCLSGEHGAEQVLAACTEHATHEPPPGMLLLKQEESDTAGCVAPGSDVPQLLAPIAVQVQRDSSGPRNRMLPGKEEPSVRFATLQRSAHRLSGTFPASEQDPLPAGSHCKGSAADYCESGAREHSASNPTCPTRRQLSGRAHERQARDSGGQGARLQSWDSPLPNETQAASRSGP